MNQVKQIPRLIMNTLIVIAAALGTVACVTTAFGLTVNYGVIVLVCTLSALLFTSCFLWKPFLWLLLILAVTGAYLIFATDMFAPVAPTFTQLVHDILTRFSSAYPNFSFAIPSAPEAYLPQDLTLLFSLMAILLSVWMAWGVGYRSCLISVAGTLPFLLLCVVINDTPPHVIPLVLLLSAWLTVLLCKERPEEPASMDAARLGITLMAVLLLLSIVGTVYPKEDTHNRELPGLVQNFLDQLPGPLQNMLSRDSHGVQNEELGADTSETLDLTTQGTRDRKDTVMMQLSSTQTGVLYLRGAAKDVYTGSSWESRNEAGAEESVYAQTSLGTAFGGSTQAAVQIRNYQDHATVAFVPYGFINCTGAEPITSDLRILCAADDYINYYWPDLAGLDLTSPTGIVNADYDAYVQETCLELPESTQNALYNLALQYGYDPSLSTLDTIAWVAEFVRTVGSYQLNVSRQPINHDFAVYFLTESKAGYCVHFATAAATMYRALGIPARYASGYRVTVLEAGGITDVTDQDTHAWAEIYLSGLGWVPVEATPGFGSTLSLPEVEHEPAPVETPQASEEPAEPSPSPEATGSSPEPSPVAPSEDPNGAAPSETPVSGSNPVTGGQKNMLWFYLLTPLAVALLLFLTLLCRHHMVVRRRHRRFQVTDCNQSIISQWQYLERLIPWGAQPSKEQESMALKAKFSQHKLTQEELDRFTQDTAALSVQTQTRLSRWKYVRFKWLSCLDWK